MGRVAVWSSGRATIWIRVLALVAVLALACLPVGGVLAQEVAYDLFPLGHAGGYYSSGIYYQWSDFSHEMNIGGTATATGLHRIYATGEYMVDTGVVANDPVYLWLHVSEDTASITPGMGYYYYWDVNVAISCGDWGTGSVTRRIWWKADGVDEGPGWYSVALTGVGCAGGSRVVIQDLTIDLTWWVAAGDSFHTMLDGLLVGVSQPSGVYGSTNYPYPEGDELDLWSLVWQSERGMSYLGIESIWHPTGHEFVEAGIAATTATRTYTEFWDFDIDPPLALGVTYRDLPVLWMHVPEFEWEEGGGPASEWVWVDYGVGFRCGGVDGVYRAVIRSVYLHRLEHNGVVPEPGWFGVVLGESCPNRGDELYLDAVFFRPKFSVLQGTTWHYRVDGLVVGVAHRPVVTWEVGTPTPTLAVTETPTVTPTPTRIFHIPGPGGDATATPMPTPTLPPWVTPTPFALPTTDPGYYYTPVPTQEGGGGPIVVVTPYHPPTPTADIPAPQPVAYSPVGDVQDWSIQGVVGFALQEYDFGCPIAASTQATGAVRLCVRYIEVQGLSFLGHVIPTWPFVGALVAVVVGFIIRR